MDHAGDGPTNVRRVSIFPFCYFSFPFLFAIVGMDHAGVGPTHVQHLMTAINIPPANEKMFRN